MNQKEKLIESTIKTLQESTNTENIKLKLNEIHSMKIIDFYKDKFEDEENLDSNATMQVQDFEITANIENKTYTICKGCKEVDSETYLIIDLISNEDIIKIYPYLEEDDIEAIIGEIIAKNDLFYSEDSLKYAANNLIDNLDEGNEFNELEEED